MFIKRCDAKNSITILKDRKDVGKFEKLASKLVDIDTDKYLYIINESVHCLEHYGPNANGDAFPLDEMRKKYHTFISSRVSVDHQDHLDVGEIFDSVFVEPLLSGKSVTEAGKQNFMGGGYIQNILGVNKDKVTGLQKSGALRMDLLNLLLDGKITDTSMGAIVAYTECSIPTCKHIAYTEGDYCEHIKGGKNREIKLANDDNSYKVFEVCHGVTWFEDSIIVPLSLGGLAGGEGADEQAKVMNIVTESVVWENKLIKLYDAIKRHGSIEDMETFEELLNIIGG